MKTAPAKALAQHTGATGVQRQAKQPFPNPAASKAAAVGRSQGQQPMVIDAQSTPPQQQQQQTTQAGRNTAARPTQPAQQPMAIDAPVHAPPQKVAQARPATQQAAQSTAGANLAFTGARAALHAQGLVTTSAPRPAAQVLGMLTPHIFMTCMEGFRTEVSVRTCLWTLPVELCWPSLWRADLLLAPRAGCELQAVAEWGALHGLGN